MKILIKTFFLLILIITNSCYSQNNNLGGPCEGCEAVYEYGNKTLSSIDTLPKFAENNPKLKITGTVFKKDGKTPEKDVILYIYHTNRDGIYEKKGDEKAWAKRHGFIRGWIKTDKDGKYTFYTFRPASYPNRGEPEHIHFVVKEANKKEYYIDDIFFDDDPLLNQKKRNGLKNRGGSGITKLKMDKNIFLVERDILLGKNIPNYK
jgi:protocatechuate 3,4-dioxygenase, beta subunit